MRKEASFLLDGKFRLPTDGAPVFVCSAAGEARLSDPADRQKSGGASSALRVHVGDYIVTGFLNNHDVVVKVWRVSLLITAPSAQTAECKLAHTLGASNHWKPDLGKLTPLRVQIESYALAVKGILAPSKKPAYSGRR